MAEMREAAIIYHQSGCCVIPSNVKTKRPTGKWKHRQKEKPTQKQVSADFKNPKSDQALSIVCGEISGGLEMIDFDCGGEAYRPWAENVRQRDDALFNKLVIERSQSGGYHIIYRCRDIKIPGSTKLARKRVLVPGPGDHEHLGKKYRAIRDNGEWVIEPDLIETRGEGGQFLCAPTKGYKVIQGDLSAVRTIGQNERKTLLEVAKAQDQCDRGGGKPEVAKPNPDGNLDGNSSKTPWRDFDERGDVWTVLEKHGWQKTGRGAEGSAGDKTEWITRPGKDPNDGHSGSIIGGRLVKIWTSNAPPFEPDKTYKPSEVFCLLECGGDWKTAAKKLRRGGYGGPPKRQGPVPSTAAGGDERDDGDLPVIQQNYRQLTELRAEAWAAIKKSNTPPRLYNGPGGISRLHQDADTGEQTIQPLKVPAFRHEISSSARWSERRGSREKGFYYEDCTPHKILCEDLMADDNPPLPYLKRIVEAPIFSFDGHLHKEEGYSRKSKTILRMGNLKLPDVPECPSMANVNEAIKLLDELLVDFPFVGHAEKAHAFAAMMLPFIREMIKGPTPLHSIEASTPGTGKSLLARLLQVPAMARETAVMTEGRDEDDWRKRLSTKLMTGSTYIILDNIRRKLDSSVLSAAISTPRWEDRLLGGNTLLSLPVNSVWLVTGNNIQMSSELVRRTIRIRLDARTDRPWERPKESFKHPRIVEWAQKNRPRLIWAILVIVQNWLANGKPEAPIQPLGSFEEWSRIMGAILASAGIDGFLKNLNEFYEQADVEGEVLRAFVGAWWAEFSADDVGAADLWKMINEREVPMPQQKTSEHGQKIALGKKLNSMVGRHFTLETEGARMEFRVEKRQPKNNALTFALEEITTRKEIVI